MFVGFCGAQKGLVNFVKKKFWKKLSKMSKNFEHLLCINFKFKGAFDKKHPVLLNSFSIKVIHTA